MLLGERGWASGQADRANRRQCPLRMLTEAVCMSFL